MCIEVVKKVHICISICKSHMKKQLKEEIFTYYKREKENSLKLYCLVEVKKWLNKKGMQFLFRYAYCTKPLLKCDSVVILALINLQHIS